MIEIHGYFSLVPVLFLISIPRSGGLSFEGWWDVVGVSVKMSQLLKIKAQVPTILAEVCMPDKGVCVI